MAYSEKDAKAPEGGGGGAAAIRHSQELHFDEEYEFSAPRFFDFMNSETEEEIRKAELWFEKSGSHAPSPFSMRVKAARFPHSVIPLSNFCDVKPTPESLYDDVRDQEPPVDSAHQPEVPSTAETSQGPNGDSKCVEQNPVNCPSDKVDGRDSAAAEPDKSLTCEQTVRGDNQACEASSTAVSHSMKATAEKKSNHEITASMSAAAQEVKTPKLPRNSIKGSTCHGGLKTQTAKKDLCAPPPKQSSVRNTGKTSAAKTSKPSLASTAKATATTGVKDYVQENQAIKKQKLEEGKTRQIHSVRNRVFHHKSKPDLRSSADTEASFCRRHLDDIEPFVSVAELIKKFESKTREVELKSSYSHEEAAPTIQRRPKLMLTRPKEPELQTTHRVRAVRIKSSAELEEEMLAKMPKFKARPLNRKILEGPTLLPPPRSMPQASEQNPFKSLTEAKSPRLHTSLRARPSRVKTSQEIEAEELEKFPKFKAKPLNKKILESKGDIGLCTKPKPLLTIPEEFHFKTDERLGPHPSLVDMFDKLSLFSERSEQKLITPKITMPNPFNLQTEERGMVKEKRFTEQVLQKCIEEEKARIPKANPYPYTTDYPVIPPKPEPKPCTKPEVFQLESLTRHEEELQKKMATLEELEKKEAERRKFKAHPIMKDSDPIPLPEKQRIPLTEVQEFVLQVDHRAEDRAEFDKKIKEKEMAYKRQREESEQAKMIEEEKALKQMRRMMVPHARPLPKFANPFLPQKSVKEVTKPKSPRLLVAQRRRQYLR